MRLVRMFREGGSALERWPPESELRPPSYLIKDMHLKKQEPNVLITVSAQRLGEATASDDREVLHFTFRRTTSAGFPIVRLYF